MPLAGGNDMGLGSREHKEEQQDAGERKDDDFEQLQAAAMQRVNSKKVVVPTASRKNIQEVDVRKLTSSQKNRILDAGLQVTVFNHCSTLSVGSRNSCSVLLCTCFLRH
jgi:UDP-N-acetylglucosamine 2-epimerase